MFIFFLPSSKIITLDVKYSQIKNVLTTNEFLFPTFFFKNKTFQFNTTKKKIFSTHAQIDDLTMFNFVRNTEHKNEQLLIVSKKKIVYIVLVTSIGTMKLTKK